MTYKRVVEILDYLYKNHLETFEEMTAIELAKRSVEREFPHKPYKIKGRHKCPVCKTLLRLTDKYCPQCGNKIEIED